VYLKQAVSSCDLSFLDGSEADRGPVFKKECRNLSRVLLISDDQKICKSIRDALVENEHGRFSLDTEHSISASLERMHRDAYDAVLLDLYLPDCQGAVTYDLLKGDFPDISVITLVDRGNEKMARNAVSSGAQDYIIKDQCDAELLGRSLKYAIERRRIRSDLRELAYELQESEARFRKIIETDPHAMIIADSDYRIRMVNPAAALVFGRSPEEMIGEELKIGIIPGKSREVEIFNSGRERYVAQVHAVETQWEGKEAFLVSMRDITRTRTLPDISPRVQQLEQALQKISSRFVGVENMDGAIEDSLASLGRLSAARAAYIYMFSGGDEILKVFYKWSANLIVGLGEDLPESLSSVDYPWWMVKLRRGEVVQMNDVSRLPVAARNEKRALERRDVKSCLLMPIISDHKLIGFIGLDDMQATEEWSQREISLLKVASSIIGGNACEKQRFEERSRDSLVKFRRALDGLMRAMVIALEMRDPYTAGHQRRVAELSKAIAIEMELAQPVIDGVHVAGVIHDIGKMYIPPEILSKPGRLDDIEFDLIKVHPKAGYEIVKSVDFPWSVDQMMLQHHERLNGSGYPGGLSGDDIMPEARILAVADVVETMTSNRPYRQALGVAKAMDEIDMQRDTLYDSDVVDACLDLFKQKGFTFSYNSLNNR